MSTERIHNFSAGPAVLPLSVVEELQEALPNLDGTGIGLMEISHRSQTFGDIVDSAIARLRRVLALPEDYEVLLLQGGASMQFCMVAMNLLRGGTADYLDTGTWSKKAAVEAKRFGDARVVWSGEEVGYSRVPSNEEWSSSDDVVYTHYTSNNTIYGTQYHRPPEASRLVCDMSSDIASRRIDGSQFDVIYAGAQKNLGPSGVTVVALSPWALERSDPDLPSMLRYRLHVEKGSMFNTPNTLGIFFLDRVLAWIEDQGLEAVAARNQRKANAIYGLLDSSGFWKPLAEKNSRSQMNVSWRLADEALEPVLVSEALAAGFSGIKGHRSVGGIRASIYNACPEESVLAFVDFLKEFERTRA
ncbi:MAG: 3-phosphoserine/phosphohydroxythreonine transaminase [Myxococcota bacterium]|nr:3-phosphoserine/phosphohydroxythreonine transaminase [Myxococcota bacterium]